MPKKLSITDFVSRCKKVHSNKYDYSESEYINKETKLKIICKIHGSFWQIPNNQKLTECNVTLITGCLFDHVF